MNIDKLYRELVLYNFFLFRYNLKGIESAGSDNVSGQEQIDIFDFDFPN